MSTDWKDLIGPVADRLLTGERYQNTADGRRYGTHGSLLVHTQGSRRGTWIDFEWEVSGGVLDLIQHIVGTDKKGAIKWLRDNGLLKNDDHDWRDRRDRDRNGWKGPRTAPAASVRALDGNEPPPPPPPPPRPAPVPASATSTTTTAQADPPPAPPAPGTPGGPPLPNGTTAAVPEPFAPRPAPQEPAPPEDPGPVPSRSRTAHVAAAVLTASVPIAGTPGAAYLAGRGTWPTDAGPLPGCVRWLPPAAVTQLPGWETDRGRMARLTPPADLDQPVPSPHAPEPPGGWQPPMCGVVVWVLQRPGEEPDAVEVEAVNMHGNRPEKWKRTLGYGSGRVFELPPPTGSPWPDSDAPPLTVVLVEGPTDALALARLQLPGVLIRAGAGTGGMNETAVADLPLDVPAVLIGDGDKPGRRAATKLHADLDATGRTCYAAVLRRGDPDELLRCADVADLADLHNERAGIYEYDGGRSASAATARALIRVLKIMEESCTTTR